MAGDTDQNRDKNKRRDAVNAVRLMCLDHDTASAASKTFQLYPCDLRAAKRVLEQWPDFRAAPTTESERVEYLLNAGWRKRSRARS